MPRKTFAPLGAHSLRERRELSYVEALPANPPDKNKVNTQIDADTKYLDTTFVEMLKGVGDEKGIKFSKDRMEGIERQRQLIRQKLEGIKKIKFDYEQEYNFQRNKLVGEVYDLLSYAKYQAEQQKDFEKFEGEELPIEETAPGEIWIKDDGKSTLYFSFAQRNPGVSKLSSSNWITLRPNETAASMQGRFWLRRMMHEGKPYFVVQADPSFDGTFTMNLNGKSRTVDIASAGEQRTAKASMKLKEKTPEPPKASPEVNDLIKKIMADKTTPEVRYFERELKIILDQLMLIGVQLEEGKKNPGEAGDIADLEKLKTSLTARAEEIGKQYDIVKASYTEWSNKGFVRKILGETLPTRESGIYKVVAILDKGIPMWVEAEDIVENAKKLGVALNPEPKSYEEDYMVRADGILAMRTREPAKQKVMKDPKDGREKPMGEYIPGKVLKEYAYVNGRWVEA